MNTYILVTGLFFLALAIVWSTTSFLNVFIKMILILVSVWSAYLLFGPANLIATIFN